MNFTGTAADSRSGGGLYWQRAILARTLLNGECTNAYDTNVNNLPSVAAIDCFLGGLVVSVVPPQMLAAYPPAQAKQLNPRIKHWLDLSKQLGHNTESSVACSCMGADGQLRRPLRRPGRRQRLCDWVLQIAIQMPLVLEFTIVNAETAENCP